MALTNLGQVQAVWTSETPPPKTSMLWMDSTNPLTQARSPKAWDGSQWTSLQGAGFQWQGDFELGTDYIKNDIVAYDNSLYIKLNDMVNDGVTTPDVSADYDLFLPSIAAGGEEEGQIQIRSAEGKFTASNLFTWLSRLLTILGNVVIKGLSASIGNALEVRNSNNTLLQSIANTGVQTANIAFQGAQANTNDQTSYTGIKQTLTATTSGSQSGANIVIGKEFNFNPTYTAFNGSSNQIIEGLRINLNITQTNGGIFSWAACLALLNQNNMGTGAFTNRSFMVSPYPNTGNVPNIAPQGYSIMGAHGSGHFFRGSHPPSYQGVTSMVDLIRDSTGELNIGAGVAITAKLLMRNQGVGQQVTGTSQIKFLNKQQDTNTTTRNEIVLATFANQVVKDVVRISDDEGVDIDADRIRIRQKRSIATATSTGKQGEICYDDDYIYICTATNTWKRTAITSW